MRRFFQLTLDLFEPLAPVHIAQPAPETIANQTPPQALDGLLEPARFAHPQANRELRLGEAVVAYRFERARRRSIGFMVTADGLVVRAPRWTPLPEVESALREKAAWIRRKLHESRERQQRQAAARIDWRDGVEFPLLGQKVRLQLDSQQARGMAQLEYEPDATGLSVPVLRLALPASASNQQMRDAVQAWLMQQARAHFSARLDHFAAQLQVRWTRLSLSSAGTRWGSARIDGAIRLNWRLMHFAPAVVDYVVAHELSHLRVMNHSPQFWDTVRSVVPDYASLRDQLKDETPPLW